MFFNNFGDLILQVRSELEAGLGGQDLSARKDEINGIIKQVMDEMDDDEDDEDDDGGGDDDDGSDFDPGSEEDRKKKKVSFPTLDLMHAHVTCLLHLSFRFRKSEAIAFIIYDCLVAPDPVISQSCSITGPSSSQKCSWQTSCEEGKE